MLCLSRTSDVRCILDKQSMGDEVVNKQNKGEAARERSESRLTRRFFYVVIYTRSSFFKRKIEEVELPAGERTSLKRERELVKNRLSTKFQGLSTGEGMTFVERSATMYDTLIVV